MLLRLKNFNTLNSLNYSKLLICSVHFASHGDKSNIQIIQVHNDFFIKCNQLFQPLVCYLTIILWHLFAFFIQNFVTFRRIV